MTESREAMEAKALASGVPEHTVGGIVRYVFDKIEPGDFLRAVFENDLMEAFGRADEINRAYMFEITGFLYNDLPRGCHGSRAKVARWLGQEAIEDAEPEEPVEGLPPAVTDKIEKIKSSAASEIALLRSVGANLPSNGDYYVSVGYDHVKGVQGLNVFPVDHDTSRRITGSIIRKLGMQPKFRKWDDAQAEARFELEGATLMVNNYKGKNCRLVETEVIVPAEPEKIIEAKPERVEKKMVMVCDEEEPTPEAE